MAVEVAWIAWYRRYYAITQEDYKLYQTDREKYCCKYSREIGQKQDCFTERLIGAGALRDYDGAKGFQNTYAAHIKNVFHGYMCYQGILFARIVWESEEIYVPPVQAVKMEEEQFYFPLRKLCQLVKDEKGIPVCYKLDVGTERGKK